MRTVSLSLLSLVSLLALTACAAKGDIHSQGDAYIRAHISELSLRSPVLGGTFYVVDIEWQDEDTALVTYEDGHIQLKGTTNLIVDEGVVTSSSRIRIQRDTEE